MLWIQTTDCKEIGQILPILLLYVSSKSTECVWFGLKFYAVICLGKYENKFQLNIFIRLIQRSIFEVAVRNCHAKKTFHKICTTSVLLISVNLQHFLILWVPLFAPLKIHLQYPYSIVTSPPPHTHTHFLSPQVSITQSPQSDRNCSHEKCPICPILRECHCPFLRIFQCFLGGARKPLSPWQHIHWPSKKTRLRSYHQQQRNWQCLSLHLGPSLNSFSVHANRNSRSLYNIVLGRGLESHLLVVGRPCCLRQVLGPQSKSQCFHCWLVKGSLPTAALKAAL